MDPAFRTADCVTDQSAVSKSGCSAGVCDAASGANRNDERPRTRSRTFSYAYSGSPTQLQPADHLPAANNGLNSSASLLPVILTNAQFHDPGPIARAAG
jgi:hypothetical protein